MVRWEKVEYNWAGLLGWADRSGFGLGILLEEQMKEMLGDGKALEEVWGWEDEYESRDEEGEEEEDEEIQRRRKQATRKAESRARARAGTKVDSKSRAKANVSSDLEDGNSDDDDDNEDFADNMLNAEFDEPGAVVIG